MIRGLGFRDNGKENGDYYNRVIWGLGFRDNGKENGDYYNRVIWGLGFRDNGKENGNYYNRVIWGLGFHLSQAYFPEQFLVQGGRGNGAYLVFARCVYELRMWKCYTLPRRIRYT